MANILQKISHQSSRGKVRLTLVFIILLVIAGGFITAGSYYNRGADWLARKTKDTIVLPHVKEIPFRQGLDLLGGTQLIYKADVSAVPAIDRMDALNGARDVIERRVNVFGVSEPNVQVNHTGDEYQVLVELAGVKDINEAVKMIGETPLLEFKEKATKKRTLTPQEQKDLTDFNKRAEKKAADVLGKVISGGDFAALATAFSEDEATKAKGGDLGWINDKDNPELALLAAKLGKGKTSTELGKIAGGYELLKVEDVRPKTNPFNEKEIEREVKASHLLICYKGVDSCDSGLSKDEALAKIKKLKAQATPANFKDLVKANSTEPGARDRAGDLGWFGRGAMVQEFEDAVFRQAKGTISDVVETKFGFHLIFKQDERVINEYKVRHISIKTKTAADIVGPDTEWQNTELTGKNLKRATVQFNPNDGSPEVSLEFDADGSKMFEAVTERNVGKPVAIYLDNYPISVPNVNEKITGGKAVISGKFNLQEAKLLVQRLNAGALPIPVTLVSEQTVGASLGKQSVANSLHAGLIGLILVAIFMIVFYRLPGLLAVFSLMVYGVLVLAIFKVWPVTLTLAGIAGFIMSLGTAVDANVLVFARLKEELAAGKPISLAVKEAFRRAWPSVRDGNISTLITCFILIIFSTSMVKGFAITLGLGILVSMFSGIIVTRNFIEIISGEWLNNKGWLFGKPRNK